MNQTSRPNLFPHAAAAGVIFAIAVFLYAPTRHYPIFLWDDHYLIQQNELLRDPAIIRRLFTREYFDQKYELSYRPVGTLSLFINYALGGENPEGYRVANIALLAGCGILLYLVIAALLGHRPRGAPAAALAAALFVAHPAHTETVNGITFREDLLCLLFCLGAFLAYLAHRRSARTAPLAACVVLFALALFSKETAIMFPAFILLYEIIFPNTQTTAGARLKTAVLRAAVLAPCALFYLLIRFTVMAGPQEQIIYHGHSAMTTLLYTAAAWTRYMRLVFLPLPLCFEYPYFSALWWCDALSLCACAGLLGLPFVIARRRPAAALGLAWFILFLLPVSNIIPIGVIMADRYLTAPLAGLAFVFAAFCADPPGIPGKSGNASSLRFPILCVIALAGIVFFTMLTVQRNRVWSSEIAFREQTTQCAPDSANAWINLGLAYDKAGDGDKAVGALKTAVNKAGASDPAGDRYGTRHRAHGNLGMVFMKLGQMERAAYHLLEALRLKPDYAPARNNLNTLILQCRAQADYYESHEQDARAVDMFGLLIQIDPNSAPAYRAALRDLKAMPPARTREQYEETN